MTLDTSPLHPHIGAEIGGIDLSGPLGEPDAPSPSRAPPGKAGADAEIDPPRGELVQRGEGVRRDGSKAVRWDRTPVPSRMRVVFSNAAAIATNGSALSICVS